jgi:type VI secretion system protein
MTHKILKTLCLGWLLFLTACTSMDQQMKGIQNTRPFIQSLTIGSTLDTNHNMPIALDLVIVGHPVLARKINTLTAAQFFKEKRQLKQDHPKHIKIRSFELIPGQNLPEFSVPYPRGDVSAAFVFARFNKQFPNRWRLLPADTVRIFVREQHLEILSENDTTPTGKAKIPVGKPATPLEDTIIL